MYHQLVEIHAIVAAQLAECARSRRTDSTSCSVRARTSQPRPGAAPFMTRLAPSTSADRDSTMSPRLIANPTWVAQVHCPVAASRARGKVDRVTYLGARSRSHATSPPSTPPTTRRPYTASHRRAGRKPQGATRRHRLTMPLTTPKMALEAVTSGAINAL
jgi:hypothetical protein